MSELKPPAPWKPVTAESPAFMISRIQLASRRTFFFDRLELNSALIRIVVVETSFIGGG
jgi:hypothetical protein